MATLNSLVVRAAQDLNDYVPNVPNRQFQRWSQEQLIDYWNEAFCVMYSLNPSKFRCPKVAKLKPGINQVFDECERVTSVIGVSDKDGNVLYEIEKDKADKKLKWGGFRPRNCPTFSHTKDYKIESYKILTEKDGSLIVKPPVPYGANVWLKFMCETPPETYGVSDLDQDISSDSCADITIGIQWVLFRALMIDEESQSSTSNASNHLQLFFKLLDVRIEQSKEKLFGIESVPKVLQQYVAREIAKYELGISK